MFWIHVFIFNYRALKYWCSFIYQRLDLVRLYGVIFVFYQLQKWRLVETNYLKTEPMTYYDCKIRHDGPELTNTMVQK